jgi:hypothetical protein
MKKVKTKTKKIVSIPAPPISIEELVQVAECAQVCSKYPDKEIS